MDTAGHPSTDLKSFAKANLLTNKDHLLTIFLHSRRQGLSPKTLKFYKGYLNLSKEVIGADITGQQIEQFLKRLSCTNAGKHAYYRALRAFYNWLYSALSGKSPAQAFTQDSKPLRFPSPKALRNAFLWEKTPKVDKAGCFSLEGVIYEVLIFNPPKPAKPTIKLDTSQRPFSFNNW